MSFCSPLVKRRWCLALAAASCAALVVAAPSFPAPNKSFGVRLAHSATTAGDCNANGTPDAQESSWSNRDDDGDGLCNAVDVCPVEADASNDPSFCQMQAITVPFRPGDPSIPHPTYSGATVTLKGIARYGGNQFMWDFGDGSSSTAWTAIANAYNLGVRHVYTGAVGRPFVATLFVRNSSTPAVVSTASYRVQIEQSSANVLTITDPAQLNVRAQMALDEGLWYLHSHLSRSTYADGSPGYRQNYGFASSPVPSTTCIALDAFETHGSSPARDWRTDPYAEDVRSALVYVLASGSTASITPQTYGNPDANGNGLGVLLGGRNWTYDNAVCAMALADSGTPGALATTGPANVYNRRFGDLAQDTVDWFAYGQTDGGSGLLGGWGYTANDQNSIGETSRWPIFAMGAAERGMGAIVPAFVRANVPNFVAYSRYTALDTNNGGWGWQSASLWPSVGFTAAGIVAHEFLGHAASISDVQAGLGFLYRHWNDPPVDVMFGNLGDSDAMYTVMRAMRDATPAALTRITDFNYNTGLQTADSFDWYYAPAADPREGIAVDLVRRQQVDGSWNDTVPGAGTHGTGTDWSTAWDAIILGATAQGPAADVGGPYVTEKDTPTQLDASRSVGTGLTYTWDLDGNGTYGDATGATPTSQWATYTADAGGVPNGTVHKVCVRVTDTAGRSDAACTAVTVKPPPHPPVARLAAVSGAAPGTPIQLSAAASTDVDGDPLTFAWDFHNNGLFADATGVSPTVTFTLPGTYAVCVRATDDPTRNAVPYSAPPSSSSACAFVAVGGSAPQPNRPPVASIVSPSVTVNGPLPRTVTFDASPSSDPDGDPLTYSWTFDDGGTSTGTSNAVTTHTFASFGSFTAHVTVSDGTLTSSADATIAVVDTTPAVPSGLVAGPTGTGVGLTWTASPNATSYEVFRSTDGGSVFSSLGSVPTASFTDSSASAGATYVYEVSASSAGGTSGRSAPASITLAPATPTGLAAAVSGGTVSLTWTASPGATGYGVFRSSDGGASFASVGPVAGASFVDAAVTAGQTYLYEVTATNDGGSSSHSAAVSVAIPLPPPSLTDPLNGASIVGHSVQVAGVAWPGATVTILDSGTSVATLTADVIGGGFAGSVMLGYGHHTIAVSQTIGGQTSAPSAAVGVDLVPFAPTLVAPALSRSPVAVSGTGAPGAQVTILENGISVGTFLVTAGGGFAGTIVLADGVHLLSARQSIAGEVSANSGTVRVSVDAIAPTVSFTGNAGTYTVDQTVAIHCLARDDGSGLASSTCLDIAGPAYSFGVGSHTYSATATDRAGNSATATTTFTVSVTRTGVCKLAKQFVQSSAKYRSLPTGRRGDENGVANGLCEKLESIESRLKPERRTALLKAFALQATALVRAGWLTASQADTLTALAQRL